MTLKSLWQMIRKWRDALVRKISGDEMVAWSDLALREEPITDPTLEIPANPDRNTELRLLDHRIELVREMMLKAKAQKKRWKHHEAKWNQLLWKRAQLSGTM